MVYKVQFPNLQTTRHAWNFIKDFAVSDVDLWGTTIPHNRTQFIEKDYKALDLLLANATKTSISFAVAYQMMALVLEGTITPANMMHLVPGISDLAQRYGSAKTAIGVNNLAQQIPTPAPDVDGDDYRTKAIINKVEDNINQAQPGDDGHSTTSKRGKHQHLALTYQARGQGG